jgi:hypothetical protein
VNRIPKSSVNDNFDFETFGEEEKGELYYMSERKREKMYEANADKDSKDTVANTFGNKSLDVKKEEPEKEEKPFMILDFGETNNDILKTTEENSSASTNTKENGQSTMSEDNMEDDDIGLPSQNQSNNEENEENEEDEDENEL